MPEITWSGNWVKTALTMDDQGWSGTLRLDNLSDGVIPGAGLGDTAIAQAAAVASLGGAAGIVAYGAGTMTGPDPGWPAAAKAAVTQWVEEYGTFQYSWFLFRVYCSAGGSGSEQWFCTGQNGAAWVGPYDSITASYAMTVSDVRLRAMAGDCTPSDRQVLDYSDKAVKYAWATGDDATATVEVTTSLGTMSASAALTEDIEVAVGMAYALSMRGTGSATDTDYASITAAWAGVSLDFDKLDDRSADGENWVHKYSGATLNPLWPPGGAVYKCFGSGSSIKLHKIATTSADADWTGTSGLPYFLQVTITGDAFSAADSRLSSQYDVADLRNTDGSRIYLPVGTSAQYQSAEHSWYDWDPFNAAVQARLKYTWAREAEEVMDDLRCPIAVPDLAATDYSADPYLSAASLLGIAHSAVNVHRPPGLAEVPSAWEGSGGLYVTADTPGTVAFYSAAGGDDPKLSRTLATRYWTQMERLASHGPDDGRSYKADWPITLKANVDTNTGGAIPLDDPLYDPLTAPEDVTNWGNHSCLRLSYTAPRDSSLTLTLTYNELEFVFDPCYTDHEHRYGAAGEFRFSKGPDRTATYTTDYLGNAISGSGAQTYYIDLRCPAEGDLERGALAHIAKVELSGFGTPAVDTEAWTLHGDLLTLCDGPAGTQHLALDFKTAYDFEVNFFGLAGWHDGAPVLEVQYGYEDFERSERGLKYIQHRAHPPGSSATGSLDYAKVLSRLCDELNLQEGFEAAFSQSAFDARWKDEDGNYIFAPGAAYWWWLRDRADADLPLYAACVVGEVWLAPGVPYNLHVDKFVRGKVHGLAKQSGNLARARSTAAVATLYGTPDGGSETTLETLASDAHGRFKSSPLREEGWTYRVVTAAGESVAIEEVVNREYALAVARVLRPGLIQLWTDTFGKTWAVAQLDGALKIRYRSAPPRTWTAWSTIETGSFAAVHVSGNSSEVLVAALTSAGAMKTYRSTDNGSHWLKDGTV